MKYIFAHILIISGFRLYAQTSGTSDLPSNSFAHEYRQSNPTLVYDYDDVKQIHNYSKNWDLDADGQKDEVYFIGTGGAHLYYFLEVKLTSENESRKFEFMQTDFPFLIKSDELDPKKMETGFVVVESLDKKIPALIIKLDESTYTEYRAELLSRQITTPVITMKYENGNFVFGCL